MSPYSAFVASALLTLSLTLPAAAQTAPPAPTLVAPSSGTSLVQPITLDWNAVVDPHGPIGSYTWQVGTTSAFTTIILAGFTNNLSDSIPTATADKVSGLPNGTYFWRVKATQLVGGAIGPVDSAWSAVRSFTVTGLGAAPAGIPAFSTPGAGAQFHVAEFFDVRWSPIPGAQYYLLEVDSEPTFSYPLTLTINALTFGSRAEAGWGNAIANIYYRVRAVSVDNVRGLPSETLTVHITNSAPVPSAPALLSPAAGATVSLPFTFDWSDTANPQAIGYDLDVDTDPAFSGSFGVLLLQGVSRSDYMLASDLPPGNYFWRVRARHGAAFGSWSAGRAITVTAAPATPPDLDLFAIITGPGNAYGGGSTQARVMLNKPAPAGGVAVKVASDIRQAEVPGTVIIPAGKTDATVSPITTGPVPTNGIVGVIRAAYGGGWQQSSLGVLPLLYGTGLSNESVVGGTSFTGTVTLQSAAPAAGATIRLISSDTSLARLPATLFIPPGGTDATFTVSTSPVPVPTRIVIETGTEDDGYRAPQAWILLTPAGSPPPPPSLSSLTLNQPSVLGEGTATGTVRLTSPAPAGGAIVTLNGSMEGQVITPPSVTVPAGSTSADFTMTAPQVVAPHWVLIQARYGTAGGTQARLLEIDPGPPGTPTLLALGTNASNVFGGKSLRGTVALVTPAPVGGGVVNLSSDNPGVAQVPATVGIAAGNSTNSFAITTTSVAVGATVRIDATAGGVTKSSFINVAPDPNAPPLLKSMTFSPASVAGGTSATGTIFLSAPAPAGGITVTLATSNPSVAKPPPIVAVPAGQISANFNVTTFAVSTDTLLTITAFFDTTQSAILAVTRAATPPPTASLSTVSVSPASVMGGGSSQGTVTLSSGAPAGGAVVSLRRSNAAIATLPATVTVPAGARNATFTATTTAVSVSTSVTLTASYNSVSRTTTLTVAPVPGPASLSSLALNPATVTGGNSSSATVSLTSAAPSGGVVVALSSSNTAVATVPASVAIAGGATSASFNVTSRPVTTSTPVTITVTYNAVSRGATLAVNPPSTGPLAAPSLTSPASDARFAPGQNIAFDWSDVTGAASYTMQIDDQDSFSSPLIVDQTVTASQFSSSTLPTKRLWWRARANSASGNPGNWSSVRRFEVKQ